MSRLLPLFRSINADRLLLCGLLFLATLTLACLALSRGRRGPWRRRLRLGAVLVAVPLVIGLWARFVEPEWIETTHTAIPWDGPRLRVAVLGDFHVPRADRGVVRRAVRLVNQSQPDLVLLSGDYVMGYDAAPHKLAILDELRGLRAARGVYAVLGNHDSEPYEEDTPRAAALAGHLAGMGFTVLRNASREILPGVTLVGMEDLLAGRADPREAFASVPAAGVRIVLVHNWRALRLGGVQRFDVAVAGHAHGGQVCLPFSRVCPFAGSSHRPYVAGLFEWPEGGKLYVTRGLGESGVRARLGCRPEVALLDLVPKVL